MQVLLALGISKRLSEEDVNVPKIMVRVGHKPITIL